MTPVLSPEPLTVVIVVDHARIAGGQAKVAFDSALGLRKAGCRPIVFAAAGPVDPQLAASGLEIHCLGQADLIGSASRIEAAVRGVWNGRAAQALDDLLSRLPKGGTVVHVHGWAKALSPAIAPPIRRSGHPAVYTMHEYFLFCPNGGFYDYRKHSVCALRPMSLPCLTTNCDSRNYARKTWRSLRQLVVDRVARLPEIFGDIVTISELQSRIVSPYIRAGARIHRVSNPVEAADLGEKPEPASGDFLFVGRISPEKGPFLFAQAAALAGVPAVYAGDGPAAAELAARAPGARLLGWKSPAEVRALMRAARALVFPSLWYEGQPLTVLEAKSVGTPVIVSDVCAAREEVEHERTGLWFKSGDADSLARALTRARDDDLISRMSKAAYASYWCDPPTVETHVDRILAVYRQALALSAPAPAELGAPPVRAA